MTTTRRPFSNGSQYMDWLARNCGRCAKAWEEIKGKRDDSEFYAHKGIICPIEYALSEGSISRGEIPEDIARRMGMQTPERRYTWDCPERTQQRERKDDPRDCRAPGCHFRATHGVPKGKFVRVLEAPEPRFCHTHWFSLPPPLRQNLLDRVAGADDQAWEKLGGQA